MEVPLGCALLLSMLPFRACELLQLKLDGVSMLNNFEFSSDAVTVWKAFDVGQGKQISKSELHGKKKLKKYNKSCLINTHC